MELCFSQFCFYYIWTVSTLSQQQRLFAPDCTMNAEPQSLQEYGAPSLSPENISLYEHSQLDRSRLGQIRLLKLFTGRGATPIAYEIIQASIADAAQIPEYEALSYCWGTAPPTCYI